MKKITLRPLALSLFALLVFTGCETRNNYETETAVPASSRSSTRVVKDEIPAEGGRKIPVIEQY